MKIKELPDFDRPREKLEKLGPKALSNLELIAVLLGKGTRAKDVYQLSKEVLECVENDFEKLNFPTLMKINGLGKTHTCQILAAFELSQRYLFQDGIKIQNASDVYKLVSDLKEKKQEYFVTLTLDGAARLIQKRVVFIGTLNQSLVHPREVFADAILDRAAGVICVHNHPSGNIQPSREDIAVTKKLVEAGKIIGIRIMDHVIIGKTTYFSFQAGGLLNNGDY
ncbi:MAG: DNA repair protein RadC [Candidatus Atribacteria bacterium]|nr:DNA repair protein RadC [Candidatus Atribacteria bacterium]